MEGLHPLSDSDTDRDCGGRNTLVVNPSASLVRNRQNDFALPNATCAPSWQISRKMEVCCTSGAREIWLIGGRPFSPIDDDHLDWTFSGFETQPKLLLERLRDRYTRCVRAGRRRRHCRSGIVRHEIQLQVEKFRKSSGPMRSVSDLHALEYIRYVFEGAEVFEVIDAVFTGAPPVLWRYSVRRNASSCSRSRGVNLRPNSCPLMARFRTPGGLQPPGTCVSLIRSGSNISSRLATDPSCK